MKIEKLQEFNSFVHGEKHLSYNITYANGKVLSKLFTYDAYRNQVTIMIIQFGDDN